MTPIVVLGSGRIGRTVAHMLQGCGDYAVTLVDHDQAYLEDAAALAPGCRTVVARFDDVAALDGVLRGAWAVVSCAPFHCNELIAERAKAAKVHYLDLTEDVRVTHRVRELATDATTAFIPQCGLAPGFVTIAAAHVIEGLEELHEVRMRTGALPEHPSNALKYNLTWSPEGLINEYIQPCEAVVDGRLVLVPALEGLERVTIGGIEFEAFNTSGGLGTFAESLAGRVRHLNYKSMRYPGHNAIMKLLLHDLRFREHPDELRRVLERSIPGTHQDIVAIFTSAVGTVGGRLVQRTYAKIIRHVVMNGRHWTAIQITTAAGVCAMLDLLREGKLPQKGFVRNEDARYADFIANRFGAHYA